MNNVKDTALCAAVVAVLTAFVTIAGIVCLLFTISRFLLAADYSIARYEDAAGTSATVWLVWTAITVLSFWKFRPVNEFRRAANAVKALTAITILTGAAILWFSLFSYVHRFYGAFALSCGLWVFWTAGSTYFARRVMRFLLKAHC